jgi:transposase
MAMGTREMRQRQEQLWYGELPTAPGHPFYKRLEEVLDKAKFDRFCEKSCAGFYHRKLGRPSLAPGQYFRIMMIGFFEGLDSERGIAWRLADSLTLRQFLSIGLDEKTPDHVTISRTRRLIHEATHQRIFSFVLQQLAQAGLLSGKTIGVDSTTLEANAAMKSIVRRDTGESYMAYLKRLAEAEGMDAQDAAALLRMDRKRKKKTSNEDWQSRSDQEAEITKLKDGRTALAFKAENAVDMETGAIVAVTTHGGAAADTGDHPRNRDRGSHRGGRVDCRTDAGRRVFSAPGRSPGSGGGQGISQQRSGAWTGTVGSANLHCRTRQGPSELARQGGGEGCGLWQPAADSRQSR